MVGQPDEAKPVDRPASSLAIDEAKVARIKQAIADGSYAVDKQQLAEKMIEAGFPHDVN